MKKTIKSIAVLCTSTFLCLAVSAQEPAKKEGKSSKTEQTADKDATAKELQKQGGNKDGGGGKKEGGKAPGERKPANKNKSNK